MSVYKVHMSFNESFYMKADFSQASSTIYTSVGDGDVDEVEWAPTPYQVADARHYPDEAAKLCVEYFGEDWWKDPSNDDETVEDVILSVDNIS